MARSTRDGVVQKRLATSGYSTFVTALITSMSFTAIMTVSYTHLDVYKRQAFPEPSVPSNTISFPLILCFLQMCIRDRVGIVRLQGGLEGGLTGVGDGRGRQSLVGIQVIDVYKRQPRVRVTSSSLVISTSLDCSRLWVR